MGFFSSSRSHLEVLEKDCQVVADISAKIRSACDQSLRGKYEYMPPEQRGDLVKQARGLCRKLHDAMESARQRQATMEQDQCPSEDLLAAQSLLVAAGLDVTRADNALAEAKSSLVAGLAEIEAFYGAQSSEARHIRKIVAEFQS